MRRQLPRTRCQRVRNASILPFVVLVLSLLIGMMGLVIDGGFLTSSQRQAQNAADAAARAAAQILKEYPDATTEAEIADKDAALQAEAERFVFELNHIPEDTGASALSKSAQVVVRNPPTSGAFAGRANFVEVIVSYPMDTFFVHVLGSAPHRLVSARAVAGFENEPRNAGLVLLDPDGSPGLSVSGANATLDVRNSGVFVYSRHKGVDGFGGPAGDIARGQPAATVAGGASLTADFFEVSGGVDAVTNFDAPDVKELKAGDKKDPLDPFRDGALLPTPTTANGVINVNRGSVTVGSNAGGRNAGGGNGLTLPNFYNPNTGVTTLFPGIYSGIQISGGSVKFVPGIYVLKQPANGGGANILTVNASATVTANGVMFYNTGSTYSAAGGTPDTNDANSESTVRPFGTTGQRFGGITLHGNRLTLTGIDTSSHVYYGAYNALGNPVGSNINTSIAVFDDIALYQRRFSTEAIRITDGVSGGIQGTLYAKWADLSLSGNGTYDFRIIAGTLSVTGNAVVRVANFSEPPKVRRVVLVE